MVNEPRVLYNDSYQDKEFMWDGRAYVFPARTKRVVEGDAAYHFLSAVNTGLKDVTDRATRQDIKEELLDQKQLEKEKKAPIKNYRDMKWRELVSIASKKGLYVPKMTREELVARIEAAQGEEK